MSKLLLFARIFADMGYAVIKQVDPFLKGEHADLNPNAVTAICEELKGFDDELDALLDKRYLEFVRSRDREEYKPELFQD